MWSHAKIILVKDNIRKLCKWAYLNVDGQNKLLEVGAVVKVVVVDVVLVLIKSVLLLTAIRRINVFMVMVRNLRVVSIGAAVATMPIGRRVDKLSTPLAVVVMATNPISFCVHFAYTSKSFYKRNYILQTTEQKNASSAGRDFRDTRGLKNESDLSGFKGPYMIFGV